MLIVFSGLPGVGKTTVARALAESSGALYLRIDSIERPMQKAGWKIDGWGYEIAHAVAADNLRLGRTVVVDCVNPWPLTRDAWRNVAVRESTRALDVEVVCADAAEHRRRVESRVADIPGQVLPTWAQVIGRDYVPWDGERLTVDTTRVTVRQAVEAIRSACYR